MGDLKKAEDYVRVMKNEYGVTSNSLFWELLIHSLAGNLDEGQRKVDELYESLTDPEIEWVRQELSAWGVNIIEKPSN